MPKRILSLCAISLMLAASLVIFAASHGSKAQHTKLHNQIQQVRQIRQIQADPPGTVSGLEHPEAISDLTAYALIFRAIATPNNSDFERKRSRAWAAGAGLDTETVDKLISVANDFAARIAPLDKEAMAIKDQTWPNPPPAALAALTSLQNQKEALINALIAGMSGALGQQQAEQLHRHVTEHLKAKMKVAQATSNPSTKHH